MALDLDFTGADILYNIRYGSLSDGMNNQTCLYEQPRLTELLVIEVYPYRNIHMGVKNIKVAVYT